jgi:hypothetical protein
MNRSRSSRSASLNVTLGPLLLLSLYPANCTSPWKLVCIIECLFS